MSPRPVGPSELLRLVEVASEHYLHGRSKQEIAAATGLSRFAVARMLNRARDAGLVRIEVSLPDGDRASRPTPWRTAMTTPRSGTAYELRAGGYHASIASVGATLRRLTHDGVDLVVPFDADEVRPLHRGAILAPWPNRVVDGRYRDENGEHQLAITEVERGHALHGLLAWQDFQPVEQTDSSLQLRAEIVPQQGYPYRVGVDVVFQLDSRGLGTEVRATNLGADTAPWGVGPHPYLRAGAGRVDDWALQLPAGQLLAVTPDRLVPTDLVDVEAYQEGALDFRRSRPIGETFVDHAFTDLTRREDGECRVSVTTPGGTGVAMSWDSACPWVQIHTADRPDPRDHRVGLAVEPMTCAPDAYNNGRGLVRLPSGSTHTAGWRIQVVR